MSGGAEISMAGSIVDTCSVPINDRYQIALENFFDPIDMEYTEIYEKFLAAKTNALITLSQKPDGVGYAKQIVASSTHLIEQTLEDLPRSGMLEEFLGNRSSNVPKQNMGLKWSNLSTHRPISQSSHWRTILNPAKLFLITG